MKRVAFALLLALGLLATGAHACKCFDTPSAPYKIGEPSTLEFGNYVRYCFPLNAARQYVDGPCAAFDLFKMQFVAKGACDVKYTSGDAYVNDVSVSMKYRSKYNQLELMPSTRDVLATFAEVERKTASVCITLPKTCYLDKTYKVSVFNGGFKKAATCCTRTWVNVPRPSPMPSPCPSPVPSPRPSPCPSPVPSPRPSPCPSPRPSPPPPPSCPQTFFPYCSCNKRAASPYSLRPTYRKTTAGLTTQCFELSTESVEYQKNTCGNFDLEKLEFEIRNECRGQVQTFTFNGQEIAPSYSAIDVATIKKGTGVHMRLMFSRGDKETPLASYKDLKGKKVPVCITLRNKCSTPETFFTSYNGNIEVSFFNPGHKCCPTQCTPLRPYGQQYAY